MIERYGLPDARWSDRLAWHDRDGFARIVVHGRPLVVDGQDAPYGILELAVQLKQGIQARRRMLIADCAVTLSGRELSAFCGQMHNGILALNLAEEVVSGRESLARAQRFAAETLDLRISGKKSTYTEELLFVRDTGETPAFDSEGTALSPDGRVFGRILPMADNDTGEVELQVFNAYGLAEQPQVSRE